MPLLLSPQTTGMLDARRDGLDHVPGFGGPDMETEIANALVGRMSSKIRETIHKEAYTGRLRMDNISAALIAHHGLNPALLAMLRHLLDSVEVVDTEFDVERWTVVRLGYKVGHVLFARDPDILLNAELSMLHLPLLPDTVVATIIGRPLRDLLSHPALDAQDIRIAGRVNVKGPPVVNLTGRRWLSGAEIAALTDDPQTILC